MKLWSRSKRNDTFQDLWEQQEALQKALGLDPIHMDGAAKARHAKDLIVGLYEEVGELAEQTTDYKHHVLRRHEIDSGNVIEELVDILKYLLTVAQLFGLERQAIVDAFEAKSAVVLDRYRSERHILKDQTRLLCVDLDDCVVDLSSWDTSRLDGGDPRKHHELLESYKDEFHSSGQFRTLPAIEGARAGLQAARDANFTIVLVTARPAWQFKRIYADTLYWLARCEIPHDLLIFNKDKVEAVHRELAPAWPIAFVEDHVRNAHSLAAARIHVLLFDRPHNKEASEGEYLTRCRTWPEITTLLKVLADRWERRE